MTTSANIIQALFGDDDDDDDDDDNNDDKSNNSADDSEDIVVENASKPASACSSSSCWEKSIGIIDNVLTIEDCNELIAVHESDPHQGFIDQLTLTRISDLVPPCNTDNDHDNDSTTPAASCVEGISPSTTAAELLASEAATATSTSSSSLVHLTLPLLRARAIMWHAVEHYYGPSVQYELVPEFTSVTGWHQGSYLKNHYDSNREYLKDRYYSAILYLNDPLTDNDNPNHHETKKDKNERTHTITNAAAARTITTKSNTPLSTNLNHQHHPCHHPNNYHLNGFKGGNLIFEIPTPTTVTTTTTVAAAMPSLTAIEEKNDSQNDLQNDHTHNTTQKEQPQPQPYRDRKRRRRNTETTTTTTPPTNTKIITPKAGRLVCFPSSKDYIHRVDEITEGTRYVITMWFTKTTSTTNVLTAMEHLHSLQQYMGRINTNTNTNDTNQSDANHSSSTNTTNNSNTNTTDKISQRKVPVQVIRNSLQQQQQQPWETSEQATIIHANILERAGIQLIVPTTESSSTSLSYCTISTNTFSSTDRTLVSSASASSSASVPVSLPLPFLSTLTTIEIKQLIAFVWWKYGLPLADFFVQLQSTTIQEREQGSVKEEEDNTNNTNNNSYDTTRTVLKNENVDATATNTNTNTDSSNISHSSTSSSSNNSPIQEFIDIEWKKNYIHKRLQGLSTAFSRWKHDGIITNVKDEEFQI